MPAMPAPQEQAAEGQAQPQGGGDAKQLIIGINSGISQILQAAQEAGAPEEILGQLQQSLSLFRGAIEGLQGGGKGAPADAGSASPEAGGNKNAVPMA